MNKPKKTIKRKTSKAASIWSIPLNKSNFIIFGIGIIVLLVGFYIMTIPPWDSDFALVISPLILLIGYFIIFPLGILKNYKNQKDQ